MNKVRMLSEENPLAGKLFLYHLARLCPCQDQEAEFLCTLFDCNREELKEAQEFLDRAVAANEDQEPEIRN